MGTITREAMVDTPYVYPTVLISKKVGIGMYYYQSLSQSWLCINFDSDTNATCSTDYPKNFISSAVLSKNW